MPNTSAEYADLKVIYHIDRIADLRARGHSVPVQIQLVLSDLCNHDCSFCLVAGTRIATPGGSKPIELVELGDQLQGIDMRPKTVTGVFKRYVERVYRIRVGEYVIEASEEHPFLTKDGWTPVSELQAGTLIAQRVQDAVAGKVVRHPLELSRANPYEVELVELDSGYTFNPIQSIVAVSGFFTVYNLTCDPSHAYEANGFAVHNCAYRMTGYTSNANFGELRADGTLNNNPARFIPTAKALEIVKDAASMGVKGVQFSVWGEERIPVVDRNGQLTVVPIGEFVDGFFPGLPASGRHESITITGAEYKSLSINDEGEVVCNDITEVYRHKAIESLYEVILADGRSVIVTGSHSLNVVRDGLIKKIPVSALTADDFIACAKWEWSEVGRYITVPPPLKQSAAKKLPDTIYLSAELCRLLGYYTAEGSPVSRSLCWVFGNGPRENGYRADLQHCIQTVFGISARTEGPRIILDSIGAQQCILAECGAGGRQNVRGVPSVIWGATPELKLEYLKGLFSGDGNFRSSIDSRGFNRNSLQLKTASRRLAQEVYMLLRQLDVRASISRGINRKRIIEGRQLEESRYFTVNVYGQDQLTKLQPILAGLNAKLVYKDSIYSSRGSRQKTVSFGSDAEVVKIASIRIAEELGRPIVYDISVQGTHRFLTASGIGCFNTGGGEPTVHADHMDVFRAALEAGLQCALVSNGAILRPGWEEVLPDFAWIRFSLDAGTPDTYASIRRVKPTVFSQMLANATKLAAEIKRQAKPTVFGISYIVTNDNYREVEQAAEVAKATGAAYIRYAAIFSPQLASYYARGVRTVVTGAIASAAARFGGDGFRVIDMFGQRVGDIEEGRPDYEFCGYQHMNVYIGGDQNVYRCCNTAYNPQGLTGSLKNQSLREFWESQAKRDSYDGFDARGCKHCAFHGKNRLLNYLAGKPPLHAEFP